MAEYLNYLFLLYCLILFGYNECKQGDTNNLDSANAIVEPFRSEKDYVYWPFGSIPFYIVPEHFDHEQSLAIMTTLSLFSYKTCIKFAPTMTAPEGKTHVLVFENPHGVRQCQFNTRGHSIDEPHRLLLGYDCIKSPYLEMMVMRALGFPFEHNRAIRNIYIDVQLENVEPAYMELFTKERHLPMQLRALPYDINSVMHFHEREFSKNGHRTIIFKDHKVRQIRDGLSPTDVKKIQIVYGPECILRDRQQKVEECKRFPGVEGSRKKREVDIPDPTKSLRVNRNITPPKDIVVETQGLHNSYDEVSKSLTSLGIENEVQIIVDQINKVTALALKNAREKFCNNTEPALRVRIDIKKRPADVLGIVESVAEYAQAMVDHAVANLTEFCEQSQSLDLYQRSQFSCSFYNSVNCPQKYKSTKSALVHFSTKFRPFIRQSTKHEGDNKKSKIYLRARDDENTSIPENATKTNARKKREFLFRGFTVYSPDSNLDVRSKRDIANGPMSDSPVLEPEITQSSTSQTNARKKRELDMKTRDIKVEPQIHDTYVRNKRGLADSPIDTEVSTQSSTIESTTVNTETADTTESVATKKVVADEKNEKTKLGEMDVVIVSTDKSGGYVDAEYVSKSNLRMGTRLGRDDSDKWAPAERRSQTTFRRMFRAKYPAEAARRSGNFETVQWEQSGSESEQKDLEEAKRVIQEDSDLKYLLEGNRHKLFESKKKKTEDSEAEVPKKKITERKKPSSESEEVPKKKRERGKKGQKEIEDYEERKKRKEENYGEKKMKKSAEDDDDRNTVKKTKERIKTNLTTPRTLKSIKPFKLQSLHKKYEAIYERPKKLEPTEVSSESNEAPEPKIKRPLKVAEDVSNDEEGISKPKKIKNVKKPLVEPAIKGESDVEQETIKKIAKKIVSHDPIQQEDSEPVGKPAKNIIEPPSEQEEEEEAEVTSKRPVPRTVDLTRKNKEFYEDRKWSDGIVPYIIKADPKKYDLDDVRRRLYEVNAILKEKTCVRIKELKPTDTDKYEDYLLLDTSPDYVTGRVGGEQQTLSFDTHIIRVQRPAHQATSSKQE